MYIFFREIQLDQFNAQQSDFMVNDASHAVALRNDCVGGWTSCSWGNNFEVILHLETAACIPALRAHAGGGWGVSIYQNFRFNPFKCNWNAWIKRKLTGTNGQPSEVLHFFYSNRLDWKLPFCLRKISISILSSYCAIIALSRWFCDLLIASLELKARFLVLMDRNFSIWHGNLRNFQLSSARGFA